MTMTIMKLTDINDKSNDNDNNNNNNDNNDNDNNDVILLSRRTILRNLYAQSPY